MKGKQSSKGKETSNPKTNSGTAAVTDGNTGTAAINVPEPKETGKAAQIKGNSEQAYVSIDKVDYRPLGMVDHGVYRITYAIDRSTMEGIVPTISIATDEIILPREFASKCSVIGNYIVDQFCKEVPNIDEFTKIQLSPVGIDDIAKYVISQHIKFPKKRGPKSPEAELVKTMEEFITNHINSVISSMINVFNVNMLQFYIHPDAITVADGKSSDVNVTVDLEKVEVYKGWSNAEELVTNIGDALFDAARVAAESWASSKGVNISDITIKVNYNQTEKLIHNIWSSSFALSNTRRERQNRISTSWTRTVLTRILRTNHRRGLLINDLNMVLVVPDLEDDDDDDDD